MPKAPSEKLAEALADIIAAFDNYGQPDRPESWERNLSFAIDDGRDALEAHNADAEVKR